MTKVLILYYSSYGHIETMAHAMAEGARETGAEVAVKRIPELVPEDVARSAHLAYVHLIETPVDGLDYRALRRTFAGPYIANGGYTRERAIEAIGEGRADLVAFGRAFIANPDLVERFRRDAPLNEPDRATFYGGGADGYTDYPALEGAAE